jgi:protein-tyrosine-phosphatase
VSAGGLVIFVCLHGNAKSLIAREWFGRLAAERGVAAHAVARGLEPENPVPAAIVERLGRDGSDVSGFEARPLVPADVAGASRVVLIGVEPPSWLAGSGPIVERWDGIPPASEGYEASRDAMRTRIEKLLSPERKE